MFIQGKYRFQYFLLKTPLLKKLDSKSFATY
jgi:hypothetical protein